MTRALLVVDAQNEFSPAGQRPVADHEAVVAVIAEQVARVREARMPIAWVQHHNKPTESPAFVPGSWGAELSPGFGPKAGSANEQLFQKDVFGAFSGTTLDAWLRARDVTQVLLVGFYSHMCVSTSSREALVRGYEVTIDAGGTGACAIDHPRLGSQSADDVRRTALLQLSHMGAEIVSSTSTE